MNYVLHCLSAWAQMLLERKVMRRTGLGKRITYMGSDEQPIKR